MKESPALIEQKEGYYPKDWCGLVPRRIRMTQTVISEIPGTQITAEAGCEYDAWVNRNGAVAAILDAEKEQLLGVAPHEFEVLSWMGDRRGGLPRSLGKKLLAWVDGVEVEAKALEQLRQTAALPFLLRLAAMADLHWGTGATVGSVLATHRAIVPSAVGVDIGCGMSAVKLSLKARDLPDSMDEIRAAIERAIPHGRSDNGGPNDVGRWQTIPRVNAMVWNDVLYPRYKRIVAAHPEIEKGTAAPHLGTLGTGNHFIEVCLDEEGWVWVMLHTGSRGVGNKIGTTFIRLAQKAAGHYLELLPNKDLAWLEQDHPLFDEYTDAVQWAQDFAAMNRKLMMQTVIGVIQDRFPDVLIQGKVVDCHHNYVTMEHHLGKNVWVTRKGAVRARKGDIGIIPGSMGARSFIVEGKGDAASLHSCSHGAGRVMSRGEAKRRITRERHIEATKGVSCRTDDGVLDESPDAYKDIDAVMAAQSGLVTIKHTLKQIACVKG